MTDHVRCALVLLDGGGVIGACCGESFVMVFEVALEPAREVVWGQSEQFTVFEVDVGGVAGGGEAVVA